jgi:PAS domain S-box-containing protein
MKISFEKTILLGFALSLSVLAFIGFASYKSGIHYAKSISWIDHTHRVIESLDNVLEDVKEAESSARGYIISNEEAFIKPFSQAILLRSQHIGKLKELVSDNALQFKRALRLDSLSASKVSRLQEFVETKKREGLKASADITKSGIGRHLMDEIKLLVTDMQDEENSFLLRRHQQLLDNASLNGLVNFIGTLGALTLLIAIYFLLMSEIRRRNRAEEEMARTNNFLNAILEHIPNMIFVKDASELRFVRFNKAGEELLGYPRSELLGKNDYDFFSKTQASFFTSKDREVLNRKELLDIEEEPIQTRLKGERWLHTKKIPLLNEKGEPTHLLGISEDITELKKQRDSIIQLNSELEAFSYSVSHDLRAPLNGMNGIASLFEEQYADKLDSEGIRMLGLLRKTSQRLSALIQDLLTFARLGRVEMQETPTDINKIAKLAFEEASSLIPGNKAEFVALPVPKASADPTLLHQVLVNLLSNAIKYSSKSLNPRVEFGFDEIKGTGTYYVKDNGAGFDMKYSNKLFHVFQRLHQENEFDGTGLGLAIVDRIISKHGGKVWAEGKIGEGAAFYFTLPSK